MAAAYRLPALRLLWWAVWVEYLLVRLFSRVGIYIPKGGKALAIYGAALTLGEIAFNLSLLVGVVALALALTEQRRSVAAGVGSVAVLSLVRLSNPLWAGVWMLGVMAAVAYLALSALRKADGLWERGGLALVLAAQLTAYAAGAAQLLWGALGLPGAAPLVGALYRGGELLAVVAPLALAMPMLRAALRSWGSWDSWRSRGRAVSPHGALYSVGATAALAAGYVANADVTAVLAMYSLGFSLSWPAYLYIAGLAAGVAVIMSALRRRREWGLALGLLFLAGFAPQLNQQQLLILVGWAVLALGSKEAVSP